MPEVGLLGHMTDVVVQELISEASRDTHVVLDTAASSAPGGHIQPARKQDYKWPTSVFSNFMFFIGLQTTTISKAEYPACYLCCCLNFPPVSPSPHLGLMKCNKSL